MTKKKASYTTTATKVMQKGQALYYACLPAGILVQHAAVNHWNANNKTYKGYQRMVQRKKVYEIRDFVLHSDALLPQNITLCTSNLSAVNFVAKEPLINRGKNGHLRHNFGEKSWLGQLKLYNNTKLWVLDGQHRTAGLKAAIERNEEVQDFPVGVVIVDNITQAKQREIFLTTNATSWKLQTDLSLQLQSETWQNPKTRNKAHMYAQDWQIKATGLCNALNSDPDSMWHNRIRLPNETAKQAEGKLIKQTMFVGSCRKLYTDSLFRSFSDADQAKLVTSYWNAIANTWGEQVANPKKYCVFTTHTMTSINAVLPQVYIYTKDAYDKVDAKAIGYTLEQMKESLHPEFWDKESIHGAMELGGGQRGVSKLTSVLGAAVPNKPL
tara:strand:- start:333 stop:1481 length:1149 start_codon:yes stop_codon:yes gene_type:complete